MVYHFVIQGSRQESNNKHLYNVIEYFYFKPRFESKPYQLAPYRIEGQVQKLMHKIDAIFVRYAPLPPLPLGLLPFIWFGVFFSLYLGLYSVALPAWLARFWFVPIPAWFTIWTITGKCLAYMKIERIGQEINQFNFSFRSTGMI